MAREIPLKLVVATPNEVRRYASGDTIDRAYTRPFPWDGRFQQIAKHVGTTGLDLIGYGTAPTVTGTPTSTDSATKPLLQLQTAASTNATAGIITTIPADVTARGWDLDVAISILSGASASNLRYFFGLTTFDTSGTQVTDATALAQNIVGFGFDTGPGRGDTGTWRLLTADGTTSKVTNGSQAYAISTNYDLRFRQDSANSQFEFFVNDVSAGVVTGNLPGNGVALAIQCCVTTLANAAKRFAVSRAVVLSK